MNTKTSHKPATLTRALWPIIATAGLMFAGAVQADLNPSSDLIAGQNTRVGAVSWEFVNGDAQVRVTYSLDTPNWCLTGIHLHVASDKEGVPQTRKGNPIPGQFDYVEEPIEFCETQRTITLDVPSTCEENFVIAAHADVQVPEYLDLLPDPALCPQGDIKVQHPGGDSYFNTTVLNAGELNGLYDGWCIDTDNNISVGEQYSCKFYSSYDLPYGLVEYPDNMDLVNWIINQGYVGQPSPACEGDYTYGDQQRAFWDLIEDNQSTSGLGEWSQCRVDEILNAAYANGEGFEPGPEDEIGIVCDVVNASCESLDVQTNMFEIPAPREETAWGAGSPFNEKNWATYIEASCPAQ